MTAMTLSHKICLEPTFRQEEYFCRACGVARFTWNWALSEWQRQYRLQQSLYPVLRLPTKFSANGVMSQDQHYVSNNI